MKSRTSILEPKPKTPRNASQWNLITLPIRPFHRKDSCLDIVQGRVPGFRIKVWDSWVGHVTHDEVDWYNVNVFSFDHATGIWQGSRFSFFDSASKSQGFVMLALLQVLNCKHKPLEIFPVLGPRWFCSSLWCRKKPYLKICCSAWGSVKQCFVRCWALLCLTLPN